MKLSRARKLKENSKHYFDEIARQNRIIPETANCYRYVVSDLKEHGISKERIADIGCGTGSFLRILADTFPEADLYGADISPVSIRMAAEKVPSAHLYEADGEDLALPDGFADVVTCMHCFHHFPFPRKVLSEMYRISKPGGLLLIVENDFPLYYRVYRNLSFRSPKYVHGDVRLYSKKELTAMIEGAGFEKISLRSIADHSILLRGYRK